MRLKRPYIASLNEVTITRADETAIIEYREKNVSSVNLTIGPQIHQMSDGDILNVHNHCIAAQLESMKEYQHVATEIPPGKSQIEYFKPGGYWTPRGDVLRCIIDSDENNETTIWIDNQEFCLKGFGKILSVFAGWGMRIIMVPEDETHQSPPIEIKEPDSQETGSFALSGEFTSKKEH